MGHLLPAHEAHHLLAQAPLLQSHHSRVDDPAAATSSCLGLLDPGAEGRREDQLLAGRDAPRHRIARRQRPALPCGRIGAMRIRGRMSSTSDQRQKKGTGSGASQDPAANSGDSPSPAERAPTRHVASASLSLCLACVRPPAHPLFDAGAS
jgi:hypothetical protein